MTKTIHFTIAGSAAGSVREIIKDRQSASLQPVNECFSIGPLFNISQPSGLHARRNYLRRVFEKIHLLSLFDEIEPHIGLIDTCQIPQKVGRIVVWCGANADEQLLLRVICANLSDVPLDVVDVGGLNRQNSQRSAVGGSNLAELAEAEHKAVCLSEDARNRLSAEWQQITSNKYLLHIFVDGEMRGVEENFYDGEIQDRYPVEFGSAARLVGEVMGQSEFLVGDTFINYRLRELVGRGVIEADDAHKQLRFMKVRRARNIL